MKEPLYITINDKQPIDHTTDYGYCNVDYDKKGRVVGIEILNYLKLEINGEEIETNDIDKQFLTKKRG